MNCYCMRNMGSRNAFGGQRAESAAGCAKAAVSPVLTALLKACCGNSYRNTAVNEVTTVYVSDKYKVTLQKKNLLELLAKLTFVYIIGGSAA